MHVHLSNNLNLDQSHFLGLLHSRDVMAMDSVQKLVSNLVIRDQLSIGLVHMTDTDARLYPVNTMAAQPAAPGQVPPIQDFAPEPSFSREGSYRALPLVFLPSCTSVAATHAAAAGTTLPELFRELHANKHPVYGAIVPWGCFDMTALLPHRYVQRYMLYFASAMKRILAYEDKHEAGVDNILSLLQVPTPLVVPQQIITGFGSDRLGIHCFLVATCGATVVLEHFM
jgi:hypothetical protein